MMSRGQDGALLNDERRAWAAAEAYRVADMMLCARRERRKEGK